MSTPHPLEEYSQTTPGNDWDPYKEPRAPGTFAGFFSEENAYLSPVISGLGQGAAYIQQGLGTLLRGAGRIYASVGQPRNVGLELPGIGAGIEEDARERIRKLTPNPSTTGTATQVVSSLASGAYRMGVGAAIGGPAGGAAVIGGTAGQQRYEELIAQGVDKRTAATLASVAAVANAAGAIMPAGFGSNLLTRVGTGAATNLGFGLANRYTDAATLEENGYHEMAKQQRTWDSESMLADLLLGGAFGAITHVQARGAAREEAAAAIRDWEQRVGRGAPGGEDASLALSLAAADDRGAPGVAVDPAARAAHAAALEQAQVDLEMGRPVNVAGSGVEDSTFARRTAPDMKPAQAMLMKALQEGGFGEQRDELSRLESAMGARLAGEKGLPPVSVEEPTIGPRGGGWEIPRDPKLTDGDREMETRFAEALQADYPGMREKYEALADTRGGKVLSVDTARELSPDYLADRTKSEAVHEPASAFIKRLYAEKLAQAPAAGEEPMVLFMGGGTGAGKSTAIKEALGPVASRAQLIYDTNLNGLRSSKSKIDQALAAGKRVEIAYVYREPVEALTGGALKRAMRQEGEFGSGRTVPIESHVATHAGSNESVREIARLYAGDPRVTVSVIDNTRGRGNAKQIEMADLPRVDYNRAREESHAALEQARASGRISEAVYQGFRGAAAESRAGPQRAVGEPGAAAGAGAGAAPGARAAEPGAGARGEPQPQRAGGRPDELTPTHLVQTATGRQVEVRPKVVESADLVTSDHPEYPAELQPRQRGARAALTEQVNKIARSLNPEMLGNAPEADRGAPIVGPGNVVESGNWRVFALRKAYEEATGAVEGATKTKADMRREFIGRDDKFWNIEPETDTRGSKFRESEYGGTQCTGYACAILQKLGKDRVKVYGFSEEENPRSSIAQDAGGHDFAIVDGKYIVDPWLPEFGPGKESGIYDLTRDKVKVEELYGDQAKWKDMTGEMPAAAAKPATGAEGYRQWLTAQGYEVAGMKQPVLVRERVTPMTESERRAFTVEANQTSVAALSPVERAAADSRLLDSAVLSQLRSGDIATAQNAPFVRAFLQKVPEGERNALVNPDGTVSQEGVRRLQAAILGKAYGGTPESNQILGRMLESTDNEMRSTMGAMLDAAPAFAKLRQAIEDGKVGPEYDLSRALTQAIETTARVRESGQALNEFLKQEDFLTRRLPVVDQLMRALYEKKGDRLAGRDKVAQTLMNYADRALKQRLDQGMLFGDRPSSPEQLLTPPKEPEREEMRPATDMFGLRRAPADAPDQAARQALERSPNLEVPAENGDAVRARAELISAAEGTEKAEERAPDALSIAANCFGQRVA